jgi:glutamyl-tRNA(Gln) amidotransferase subunit E
MKDITEIFSETNSKTVKKAISKGGVVIGEKIENFTDTLSQNPDALKDMVNTIEEKTGIKGFIFSHELPQYGISAKEKMDIEKALELDEKDAAVLITDQKDKAEAGMKALLQEIR